MDSNFFAKMIRKARRLDAKSKDEKRSDSERREASLKRDTLEMEIASRMYDPHAISNAEIEVTRQKQLLNRKSTDDSNRDKRVRKLQQAEYSLHQTMAESTRLHNHARELLDNLMGRVKEEAEGAADAQAAAG